jgi:hypothetical protein
MYVSQIKTSPRERESAQLLTTPHELVVEWHGSQQIALLASHAQFVGTQFELCAQHVVVEIAAVGVLHQYEQTRHLRPEVCDLIELQPRVLVVDEVRVLGQCCEGEGGEGQCLAWIIIQ